jgi:hypothetical protein
MRYEIVNDEVVCSHPVSLCCGADSHEFMSEICTDCLQVAAFICMCRDENGEEIPCDH